MPPGNFLRRAGSDFLRFLSRTSDPSIVAGQAWARTDGATNIRFATAAATNAVPMTSRVVYPLQVQFPQGSIAQTNLADIPVYRFANSTTDQCYFSQLISPLKMTGDVEVWIVWAPSSTQTSVKECEWQLETSIALTSLQSTAQTTHSAVVHTLPSGVLLRTVQHTKLATLTNPTVGTILSGRISRNGSSANDTMTNNADLIAVFLKVLNA